MQSKNYRLAVDENGSPFVLNSRGSIDFGYITEEMNLPPAPIRIAEGNDRYGLTHIDKRHSDQLKINGFDSALEFVEYVASNFERIKQGIGDTFLLEVESHHNDTLFVKLCIEKGYWKKRKRKSTPALTTGHCSLPLTVKVWASRRCKAG